MKTVNRLSVCSILFCLAFLARTKEALATDENYAARPLDGSKGQLHKDSTITVGDSVFLHYGYQASAVRNVITFNINEFSNLSLPDSFEAHLVFKVYYSRYSTGTGGLVSDSTGLDSLIINYNKYTGNYTGKAIYNFTGGYIATVKIFAVNSTKGNLTAYVGALMLQNEIWITRDYSFSCTTDAITVMNKDTSLVSVAGELRAFWNKDQAADQYDLEWTYIDSSALPNYFVNGSSTIDPRKVFVNNASRVSISGEEYRIPLLYDNTGSLFFRVRSAKVAPNNQRFASVWSSDYTGGLGRYDFRGHARLLNWQASTSFAEEGKRKSVVQYFDGSLRSRQSVTKDNTTDTTVIAETYFDYQGRPTIQVMPAPTLSRLINYAPGFNLPLNGTEYDKTHYDTLISGVSAYCDQGADSMVSNSGASNYYSSNNPNAGNSYHKYIPNAKDYPFSETRYTQDNTGRISVRGGVGPDYQIGKADPDGNRHETRYYYVSADQEDLDALFGTEAGQASHYFKNVVRDANGQYNVAYTDMYGRTVATALAGKPREKLDTLAYNQTSFITRKLIDSTNNIVKATGIVSSKALIVTKAASYHFIYSFQPDSISLKTCDSSTICYDCKYDLDITISDDCNNGSFGGIPVRISRSNLSLNGYDTVCNANAAFPGVDTTLILSEGSYTITKTLTISRQALNYYRDSIFLRRNTCRNLDQTIQVQKQLLQTLLQCYPSCQSCTDSLGTWAAYQQRFMTRLNILPADSAGYRSQALAAYTRQKQACDQLCNNTGLEYSISQQMLADLTPPSGQYAGPDNLIDTASIFYVSKSGLRRYQQVNQYVDESGKPDLILLPSGIQVRPQDLSTQDFIDNFKTSWADSLLPLHPEYCKLKVTQNLTPSNVWDETFRRTDTYAAAKSKGYLNPTANSAWNSFGIPSTANQDPFYGLLGLASATYLQEMQDSMTMKAPYDVMNHYTDIWSLATIMAHCAPTDLACQAYFQTNLHPFQLDTACTGELDMAWRNFREMYQAEKRRLIAKFLNGSCLVSLPPGHYANFTDPAAQGTQGAPGNIAQGQSTLSSYITNSCNAYVQQWWAQLAPCNYTAQDSAVIIPRLIQVCQEGGDASHAYGASTVNPASTYRFRSFEDVLKQYNDSTGVAPYNATCNAYLMTAPAPYDQQPVYTNLPTWGKPDSCQCSRINDLYTQYQLNGSGDANFSSYLLRTTGTVMSQGSLDTLRNLCSGVITCTFLPAPVNIPPALQCGVKDACASCVQVSAAYNQYKSKFPEALPGHSDTDSAQRVYNKLFENYMNASLGFGKRAWEYLDFLDSCTVDTVPATTYCNAALKFDGTANRKRVILPVQQSRLNLGLGNFTFEARLKPVSGLQFSPILNNRTTSSGPYADGFTFLMLSSGNLLLQLQGCPNYTTTGTAGINMFDGKAHSVAVVKTSDSLSFFMDGLRLPYYIGYCGGDPPAPFSQRNITSTGPYFIGYDSLGTAPYPMTNYNGWINEVRIWNVARTQTQISQNLNVSLTPQTGLIGYYPMTSPDTCQQVILDYSTTTDSLRNNGMRGSTLGKEYSDPVWLAKSQISYTGADPAGVPNTCACSSGNDTASATCDQLEAIYDQYRKTYIQPSNGYVDLDMRTFSGNITPAQGPKGVFDVNGSLIGNTVDSTTDKVNASYATIWNSSMVNQQVGALTPLASGKFRLTLKPGQAAPCKGIVGMRYYRVDIPYDTLDAVITNLGSYVDFGDGQGIRVDSNYTSANTKIGIIYPSMQDYFGMYYVAHVYPNAQNRTITVYHTDINGILGFDNYLNGGLAAYLPLLKNLRGYAPQDLKALQFHSTQDTTVNTFNGLVNKSQLSGLVFVNFIAGDGSKTPFLNYNFGSLQRFNTLKYFWIDYWGSNPPVASTILPNIPQNFPNLSFLQLRQAYMYSSNLLLNSPVFNFVNVYPVNTTGQVDTIINQVGLTAARDSGLLLVTGALRSSASATALNRLISKHWTILLQDTTINGTIFGSVRKDTVFKPQNNYPLSSPLVELINNTFGGSMTYNQVKALYLARCGKDISSCAYTSTNSTLSGLQSDFLNDYTNYGRKYDANGCDTVTWKVNTGGTSNNTTRPHKDIFTGGIAQFPDSLSKGAVPYTINYDFNDMLKDSACVNGHFSIEFRVKSPVSAGETSRGIRLTLLSSFNPLKKYTIVLNQDSTAGNFITYTDSANLSYNKTTTGITQFMQDFSNWRVVKFEVQDTVLRFYLDGTLLRSLNFTGVSMQKFYSFSLSSFARIGKSAQFDYVKLYDGTGKLFLQEDFNDCGHFNQFSSSIECPKRSCSVAFTDYYNRQQHTALSFAQIDSTYSSHGLHLNICQTQTATRMLCGKADPVFPPAVFKQRSTCDDSTSFTVVTGTLIYNAYRDSLVGNFNDTYLAKCLKAYKYESFTVNAPANEYHYTLYYFDQAGNLVKTVPPSGVNTAKFAWASAWSDSVKLARQNKQSLVPVHGLPTIYKYNTLNQMVAQQSPDAGVTSYWYDRLARLAVSQNARQQASSGTELNKAYSYTSYDYLGRVTETGQIKNATSTPMNAVISRVQSTLDTWISNSVAGKEQITQSVYDLPYGGFTGLSPAPVVQRNLRNRVSYTTYSTGSNPAQYNSGTFYTYDIDGGTDTLLQDFGNNSFTALQNVMNANGSRFKKIVYRYDLVSGKVNHVAYQPGQADQFLHRYSYDAENRLILVETSQDSVTWEKDARYQYYLHGPLARTVLGDQMVQGLDYAYTLQGWLKGVNSTSLLPGSDMGNDGSTNSQNRYIGKDAYSFHLNYFAGDYTAISGATPFPGTSGVLAAAYKPLYNGNITSMAVNIGQLYASDNSNWKKPLLYNYSYDQLNRLTGMDSYYGLDQVTNNWPSLTQIGDYKERIAYDANGNILKYLRNNYGNTSLPGLAMDSLNYAYLPGTNKLVRINDGVTTAVGNGLDLQTQPQNNYAYDAIGNLIGDSSQNIPLNGIKWNVYGKITEIDHSATTTALPARRILYTYDAAGQRISKQVTYGNSNGVDYTWYVRDAAGNVLATYAAKGDTTQTLAALSLQLGEQDIYGSKRLGLINVYGSVEGAYTPWANRHLYWKRGLKQYELPNHLGNILTTVSDRKFGIPLTGNSSLIDYFKPEVIAATDYAPFGMLLQARNTGSSAYRYGFNGKENDNEVKGIGNQIDYGMRVYDPRIGKFLSVDALTGKYPWYTPYQYAGNKPIWMTDLDGNEENPSKYMYDALKVPLKDMPASHTTSSGRSFSTSTRANGLQDNSKWYWDQVRANNPDMVWSKGNTYAIDNGFSPVADKEFITQFPAFKDFKGQVLEMHHLDQKMEIGIALPEELHRGAGFYKLWHAGADAFTAIGMLMTLYQQTVGKDPLLVDMATRPKYEEEEKMMTDFGLKNKDFSSTLRFAAGNNNRTGLMRPGTVGIFYATQSEMANFQFLDLSKASPGSFITGSWGAFYPDANTASQALQKRITYAVVYFQQAGTKGFTPVNAFELAKPQNIPPPSTFQNKKD